MNKHIKRKFTPEFKFKVALEALQEKLILAEIASKYELHSSQISDWKQQAYAVCYENGLTVSKMPFQLVFSRH